MTNFKRLEKQCPEGIPFSECRAFLDKKKKKTKKKGSQSPSRKKKRKITKKRPIKRVPPKGVIIRKGGKYYKSNGFRLQPLINK